MSRSGRHASMVSTYTGIVVEMCTVSAVSATRMRRNMGGPWLDEGPSDVDNGSEPRADPKIALPPRLGVGTLASFSAFFVIRDGCR